MSYGTEKSSGSVSESESSNGSNPWEELSSGGSSSGSSGSSDESSGSSDEYGSASEESSSGSVGASSSGGMGSSGSETPDGPGGSSSGGSSSSGSSGSSSGGEEPPLTYFYTLVEDSVHDDTGADDQSWATAVMTNTGTGTLTVRPLDFLYSLTPDAVWFVHSADTETPYPPNSGFTLAPGEFVVIEVIKYGEAGTPAPSWTAETMSVATDEVLSDLSVTFPEENAP